MAYCQTSSSSPRNPQCVVSSHELIDHEYTTTAELAAGISPAIHAVLLANRQEVHLHTISKLKTFSGFMVELDDGRHLVLNVFLYCLAICLGAQAVSCPIALLQQVRDHGRDFRSSIIGMLHYACEHSR